MPITVGQYIGRGTNKYRSRYNKLCPGYYGDGILNEIPCGDHLYHVGPYIISRPYRCFMENYEELIEWCQKYGLTFTTEGISSWHPATILIEIFRQEWVDEFHKGSEQYGDAFHHSVAMGIYERTHAKMTRIYSHYTGFESGVYIIDTRGPRGIGIPRGSLERIISAEPGFHLGDNNE